MFTLWRCELVRNNIKSSINLIKNYKLRQFSTEERLKETTLENWKRYWKGLYQDYRDVAIDIANDCKNRPIRALTYLSRTCYYLHQVNPDECSFREALLQNTMRLIFVGEGNRNPVSVEHISHMTKCFNENIIRRLNLGVISFIWLDNYSNHCCQYKATCIYPKPRYVDFYKRIVDIGFFNRWWILEDKMKDYDINIYEFE